MAALSVGLVSDLDVMPNEHLSVPLCLDGWMPLPLRDTTRLTACVGGSVLQGSLGVFAWFWASCSNGSPHRKEFRLLGANLMLAAETIRISFAGLCRKTLKSAGLNHALSLGW